MTAPDGHLIGTALRDLAGRKIRAGILAPTPITDFCPVETREATPRRIARFGEVAAVGEEIVSHDGNIEDDPLYAIESIEETSPG